MRGTRAHHDAFDRPPASGARLPGPLIDLQVLLHRAVTVGRRVVVDGAAAPLDRLGQDGPHGLVEVTLVGRSEGPGRAQRVETCGPQRLVGIDIADPDDECLIEQERLEPTRPTPQPPSEVAHGERRIKRLGTERGEDGRPADLRDELPRDRIAPIQPDPPEFADVAKADLAPVGQLQDKPDVWILRGLGRDDEELPGHLQMDRQRGVTGQLDDDLLGPPPDRLDLPAGDGLRKGLGRMRPQCPRPRTTGARDRGAQDARPQVARDRLDLG